ncbi:MAG: glycerophosphodiester phosphodiesterase [Thermoplasmatota archaeon]
MKDGNSRRILRIGHRGAAGHIPENTLASFRRAIELESDMVELDVQVCRSGELVVIHDPTVDRTTDGSGNVSDLDLWEIRRLNAGMGERIPTIDEVFDEIGRTCSYNIELKGRGSAGPAWKSIKKRLDSGWKRSQFLVSSFDPIEIYEFSNLNFGIRTGFLVDLANMAVVEFIKDLEGYSIHPRHDAVDREFIKQCKSQELAVYVWTPNTRDSVLRSVRIGADGVITDFPELVPKYWAKDINQGVIDPSWEVQSGQPQLEDGF